MDMSGRKRERKIMNKTLQKYFYIATCIKNCKRVKEESYLLFIKRQKIIVVYFALK
jgi:hypothetical protein